MKGINVKQQRITSRDSRSVTSYLHDLKMSIPLNPEVEYELAVKASKGDEEAREKIIKANLKFVVSVAKQLERKGIKLEDLINEGNIGLIESVKTFDPSRGFKFISYAVWKIRQKMQMFISNHRDTIRLPSNKNTLVWKIRQRYNILEQKLQRTPSYNEMLDDFSDEFTEEEIDFFVSLNNHYTASLDEPRGDEYSGVTNALVDTIGDKESPDPSKVLDNESSQYNRSFLLSTLSNKEATILELIYGFNGYKPYTIDEVAEVFGVSSQVISVQYKRALKKLKYKLGHQAKWMMEN